LGADVLKPVGFWSYARQDDSHSDGQLTQLRAIVGNAISLRLGDEVKLFQDTAAIPFGADWASNIEEAIGQTTFFIPIVTPRFLKSENCRDEFKSFRRRMNALGRGDLIFPIHYVDVDRIGRSDTAFGDELALLLRQQWIDFRPLQFEDVKSAKVRQWADALAVSVVRAMNPGVPVTKLYSGRSSPPPRESGPAEPGGASQANRASSGPASAAYAAQEPDAWAAPASPRSASPQPVSFAETAGKSLLHVSTGLLAVLGRRIEPNPGVVAGKTCVAIATFLSICILSFNFNYDLLQSTYYRTYVPPIAVGYLCVILIFSFVKSKATPSYLVLLAVCYLFLMTIGPYIGATHYTQFRFDWEQFFNLNSWMDSFPPAAWIHALPLDDETNQRFLYYVIVPTVIARRLSGLFR
jgi:TIR domain